MYDYMPLKDLIAFTTAGVVWCGGPKKYPRTSSIMQIIFFFWSFEIREGILRNQKIIIGLDSFANYRLIYMVLFGFTSLCIDYAVERCKDAVIFFWLHDDKSTGSPKRLK